MSDIIHLLSDAIANQIAAGEVIQRPASVVKELMENSLDAGAKNIHLIVKDAGRTLIQVVDDGKGISETDARMAFERHATSKIRSADDLFALNTMGFRGEALASIAAVAQVELRTARPEDPTGTRLTIAGSKFESQESIACNPGSVFSVKNLFFNVPARRKFLKSNDVEFRNIIAEFERIVLVNPQISFTLQHNDVEVMNLPQTNLKQRILNVFGKRLNAQLFTLQAESSIVTVNGFIGAPETSRKRGAQQFFFANNRYMRHPYFHKAVMNAFEPFISAGDMPNYFIYITIDPAAIDVNIHPTKTEIKFENEQAIWMVISAAVKEAIGKSKAVPSIEFDQKDKIDIPVYNPHHIETRTPSINLSGEYNPFKQSYSPRSATTNWEKLYVRPDEQQDEKQPATENETSHRDTSETAPAGFFQEEQKSLMSLHGKYIVTPLKSGLCIIDQRRAHIRVLFDACMSRIEVRQGASQGLLFPETVSFTPQEAAALPFMLDDLAAVGFDLADLGGNVWAVNGAPADLGGVSPVETLREIIARVMETGCEVREEMTEALALALAGKAAIPANRTLTDDETASLTARLFASSSPNYTPDGKPVLCFISDEEIEKKFR